jgi:ParB-like chromosome segregation protein Spo0J
MKTETIEVDKLTQDPVNARKHSARNIDAIKASLARFGQQKPIVIDANNVVRAGNGTLEAAKALGWEDIRVIRSELDGSEMTAFAIADNRTAELAEWDYEVLGQVLGALEGDEEGRASELGWAEHELANILVADWTPPESTADLGQMGDIAPLATGEEARSAGVVTITFSEEEAALIDEVALILSPDEELSRHQTVIALARSAHG